MLIVWDFLRELVKSSLNVLLRILLSNNHNIVVLLRVLRSNNNILVLYRLLINYAYDNTMPFSILFPFKNSFTSRGFPPGNCNISIIRIPFLVATLIPSSFASII